jgi:hypothetical protein
VTLAAALLGAPLWLAAVLAGVTGSKPEPSPAAQRIRGEVRGPVARVEVTRALTPGGSDDGERVLDVALPEHAELVDVAFDDAGKWRTAGTTDASRAVAEYLHGLEAKGLAPTREAFEEGTSWRIRVAGGGRAPVQTRYRFVLLPETADGRSRIRFPASLERAPSAAEVTVAGAGGDVVIAGEAGARGHVSTRGAWEISWAPRATASRGNGRLDGTLAFAKVSPTETLAAVSVEARARPPIEPPPSVLFLIDRSRSVGLPGLAAERDLAQGLLEALPPATRFDALFFDRDRRRLFPMSRPATREALGALEAEMVPDRLRNGTDLPGALREAGELLRREASAFAPRTWLVVVTDGALPDAADGAALERALGAVPGVDVTVAAFIVRPKDDEGASEPATRALRQLAAARGGVLRTLTSDALDEALPPTLSALARGGDVADVRLDVGGGEQAIADGLAPGEGRAKLLSVTTLGPSPAVVAGTAGGRRVRASLRGARVDAAWLRALRPAAVGGTRVLTTAGLVALVEAGPTVIRPDSTVHGSLDRTVVRNTLSLAFMPRARACYLNRTAATPALRDLTGRVRLSIDLTRGEVGDVVVQSSTLHHPDIERCLRDGAFSIEVPRALRSDSPSTAILNLVFRPRTPEKAESAEEAALGEQIDLVIDELHRGAEELHRGAEELHRGKEPPDAPPPPDRSMIPTR